MQTETVPPITVLDPVSPEAAIPVRRKIARLPKPLRDMINAMLEDSVPAREIIAKLQASSNPPLPYPISEKNISDWRSTGYQRYLAQQERLDLLQANREHATDLVASDDLTTLPEATLQIVANQYFEVLLDFSPDTLKEKLAEDPVKYIRFLNVFARLVREIVHLKKLRNASPKPEPAKPNPLDPDRDLSDDEFEAIVRKMDKVFKVARPSNPPVPPPSLWPTELETSSCTLSPALSQDCAAVPAPSNPSYTSYPPDTSDPSDLSAKSDPSDQSDPAPNQPLEHCLECHQPLPPLRPNGSRLYNHCNHCRFPLPPPGSCREPSIEQCKRCRANLPRLLPNGQRPDFYCHNCTAPLPAPPPPSEGASATSPSTSPSTSSPPLSETLSENSSALSERSSDPSSETLSERKTSSEPPSTSSQPSSQTP